MNTPNTTTTAPNLLHITVSMDTVLQYIGEQMITRHVKEWRDSVTVGDSVTIIDLLTFSSTVFPSSNNPPVDALMACVFEWGVEGIKGVPGVPEPTSVKGVDRELTWSPSRVTRVA